LTKLEIETKQESAESGHTQNSPDICDQRLHVVSRFHIFDQKVYYLSFLSRLRIFYTTLKRKIVHACLCTFPT